MTERHLNIKHNYTVTKNQNKLKAIHKQKTIEQSYQGLKTEGVRCWAEGQEEEEAEGNTVSGRVKALGTAATAVTTPHLASPHNSSPGAGDP